MIPFSPPLLVRTHTSAGVEGQMSFRLALGCLPVAVGSHVARLDRGSPGVVLLFLCCDEHGQMELMEAGTVTLADSAQLKRITNARMDIGMKGGNIDQAEKED